MWCRRCKQDVPAIGSIGGSAVRCARCHEPFSDEVQIQADAPAQKTTPVMNPRDASGSKSDWFEKALLEDWEFDDDLNEAQQLIASLDAGNRTDASVRFDHKHRPNGYRESSADQARAHRPAQHLPAQSSLFPWFVLSLGMMVFVFGAVLIGWSFAEGRPELWRLGLPFTLGGQATLIVGLVLQLDGLWRSNRDAADALNELDSQLDELRHTTSLLATTHSSSAQSFYLHMADGASPNLLLADLKGQLDLLASRLANKR